MSNRVFEEAVARMRVDLLIAPIIRSGRWQSTDVDSELLDTPEVIDCGMKIQIPETMSDLQSMVRPNLPWAEEHFQERVAGQPTNPGDTYMRWPWYKSGVEDHKRTGQFSHTYQERFWPTKARHDGIYTSPLHGIRYDYGDLDDVVTLLATEPLTRQAYLPVWFPEDTGVVHGERVPCSLGYQFLIRDNSLHVIYHIRSCDFVRYFRDDIYMASRLAQWVRGKVDTELHYPVGHRALPQTHLQMGFCTMNIGSLHCFRGDLPKLKKEHEEYVSTAADAN